MDNWVILNKELEYYGIRLIDDTRCECIKEDGQMVEQGVIKTIRMLKSSIKKHKQLLASLWENACELLEAQNPIEEQFHDENLKKIFIHTLKDMSKFLLMFEELQGSQLSQVVEQSLSRDINSFISEQLSETIDYKISIDWIYRTINLLSYLCRLLASASLGRKKVSGYNLAVSIIPHIKIAKGISGPWANLDLPTLERVYPFEQEEQSGREKDKQMQQRYRKGFENYNNDGRVGEGHYWRELKNEPYAWSDNDSESPYPHRNALWS